MQISRSLLPRGGDFFSNTNNACKVRLEYLQNRKLISEISTTGKVLFYYKGNFSVRGIFFLNLPRTYRSIVNQPFNIIHNNTGIRRTVSIVENLSNHLKKKRDKLFIYSVKFFFEKQVYYFLTIHLADSVKPTMSSGLHIFTNGNPLFRANWAAKAVLPAFGAPSSIILKINRCVKLRNIFLIVICTDCIYY